MAPTAPTAPGKRAEERARSASLQPDQRAQGKAAAEVAGAFRTLHPDEPLARARRARTRQRRVLIKVGYSCNDRCVFCHTDFYRQSGDATTSALIDKISQAREAGFDMVVFSGGEATMRRDLFRLARAVHRGGMALGFITNGRVMSYDHVVRRLLGLGLAYVHLSLHGTRSVHNRQVRDASFHQTFGGIENLHGKVELTVSCVVTRINMAKLRDLVDLLLPFPELTLKFSCCEPKGEALHLRDLVVPALSEAAGAVQDALSHGLARRGGASGPSFAVENFPYCLVPAARLLDDDLMANRLVAMTEVWDPVLYDIDDFNKTKPTPCQACALDAEGCPGIFVETHREEGAAMLRPTAGGGARPLRRAAGLPLPWVREQLRPGDMMPIEEARSVVVPSRSDVAIIPVLRPLDGEPGVRPSTDYGVMAAIRAHRGRVRAVQLVGRGLSDWDGLLPVVAAARSYGIPELWVQDLESRVDPPAPPEGPDRSGHTGDPHGEMVPRDLWWPLLAGEASP